MSYIPEALRRQVIARANSCCEYCHLAAADDFMSPEIDHIIAEKHEGETTLENLALSCFECNRHKGSDIASVDRQTQSLTWLFNPRTDRWHDHFQLNGVVIEPLTATGRVTVRLLHMNDEPHLAKREELLLLGRYPCAPLPSSV